MKKTLFYLFFIALGTIFAEALSFNHPSVILEPWGYIPYGVLYALFIDNLIKRQVDDWKTIYLYGVLVGFITEAYMTKVIFFGWSQDAFIYHGFAIVEGAFLTFFFHPLISLIIPIFIAGKVFKYPFALNYPENSMLVLKILPLYPAIMLTAYTLDISTISSLFLTAILFLSMAAALKKVAKQQDVLLKKESRSVVMLLTILFYSFSFFFFPTSFSKKVILPSLTALLISMAFLCFIGFIIHARNKSNIVMDKVEYHPDYNMIKIIIYSIICFIFISSLILTKSTQPFSFVFSFFYFGGILIGVPLFVYCITLMIKDIYYSHRITY